MLGADDLAAGRDVVEPVALDDRRGAAGRRRRPVLEDLVGGHVVDDLPEELAVGLVEAHEDGLVALDLGIARHVVVGADVDLAAGDDRAAVGLGAELGDPLDVLAACLPRRSSRSGCSCR